MRIVTVESAYGFERNLFVTRRCSTSSNLCSAPRSIAWAAACRLGVPGPFCTEAPALFALTNAVRLREGRRQGGGNADTGVAFLLLQAIDAATKLVLLRHRIDIDDNLQARAVYTQVGVLKKVAVTVVAVFTLAAMLMVFEPLRQFAARIAGRGPFPDPYRRRVFGVF